MRFSPSLESLETKAAPGWIGPGLTYSVVPDGTVWLGGRSSLQADIAKFAPTWREDVDRAIQAWSAAVGLMARSVTDPGTDIGSNGPDIRIGGTYDPSSNALAWAYYPGPGRGGDITFNLAQDWSKYDFFSVMVHESGHAVADLEHGESPAMSPAYSGKIVGLTAADVAAAKANSTAAYSPAMVLSKSGRYG